MTTALSIAPSILRPTYKGMDDLMTRRILPNNVYDDIKDKIVARQQ